jgi:5-methylcytosine-specific restriction endonuclease McrA
VTAVATVACAECSEPVHARGLCRSHYNRWYYEQNPEKQRARARQWGRENAERVRERNHRRDRARMAAYQRRRYRENPLRGRVASANAKAKRLGVPGRLTVEGVLARFRFFGDLCWLCDGATDTIDHVKPLAKGGANTHSNIRPACLSCNTARCWEARR